VASGDRSGRRWKPLVLRSNGLKSAGLRKRIGVETEPIVGDWEKDHRKVMGVNRGRSVDKSSKEERERKGRGAW